jgi:hypothetical protein
MIPTAIRPSHPAMSLSFYPTPPASPTSPADQLPLKRSTSTMSYPTRSPTQTAGPPPPPKVDYALLRAHHTSAVRYVISKLRWEQANNAFLQGESAWREHNRIILRLEDELKSVQAAQKALDQFADFCHAPIAPLVAKPYGPPTEEQVVKAKADAERRERELDAEVEKNFPFVKQLFIGPMTKQQARNDRVLRKCLKEGDLADITELLPSANLRMALKAAGQEEKKVEKPRPYHQVRMEREEKKIRVILEEEAARIAKLPARTEGKKARIGPMTQAEHVAALPVFGPKTRAEALLPIQREHRHVILSYLRRPWPQYDDDAAQLMEELGRLAVKRLNHEVDLQDKK